MIQLSGWYYGIIKLFVYRLITPLKTRFDKKGETAATTATAEKTFPTSSVFTVLVKMDLKPKSKMIYFYFHVLL